MVFPSTLLAWLGVASPLLFFAAVDKYAKVEIKQKFARKVFRNAQEGIESRLGDVFSLLYSTTGGSFLMQSGKLLSISLISIVFVYSTQYLFVPISYNEGTQSFVQNLTQGNLLAVLMLLSFMIVDAVSFKQTLIFSRLAAQCKNIFEIVFMAIADIATSLVLVVLLLPLLIYLSEIASRRSDTHELYVQMIEVAAPQPESLIDVIEMLIPNAGQVDLKRLHELNTITVENGWYLSSPNLYVAPASSSPPSLSEGPGLLEYSSGRLLYYWKGEIDAQRTAASISNILKSNRNIEDFSILTADDGAFGTYNMIFRLKGQWSAGSFDPIGYYTILMSEINFFGLDFDKLYELGSKNIDENDLYNTILIGQISKKMSSSISYICDGDPQVREVGYSSFVSDGLKECESAVAIPSSIVNSYSNILGYRFRDVVTIPILPTSLSSIYMTAVVYFSLILWSFLPYVGRLFDRFAEGGFSVVEDRPFTIAYLFVLVFGAAPCYFLLT